MARVNDYDIKNIVTPVKLTNEEIKNSEIIVVDMINGFCSTKPYGKDQKVPALADDKILDIVPNIQNLLEKSCFDNVHFLADYHTSDSVECKVFPLHCHNFYEYSIVSGLNQYLLKVDSTHLIPKNSINGFYALEKKNIIKQIIEKKLKHVILVGCCTDLCVFSLALALRTWFNENNIDIDVVVPIDCVDTYDIPIVHEANYFNKISLELMKLQGITVLEKI